MEKTEGGLTAIEDRAFRELALGAGAIDIKIHVGKSLNAYGFQFDEFEEEKKASASIALVVAAKMVGLAGSNCRASNAFLNLFDWLAWSRNG